MPQTGKSEYPQTQISSKEGSTINTRVAIGNGDERFIVENDNNLQTLRDSPESFLPCGIPDLQLDFGSVELNRLNFEVDSENDNRDEPSRFSKGASI